MNIGQSEKGAHCRRPLQPCALAVAIATATMMMAPLAVASERIEHTIDGPVAVIEAPSATAATMRGRMPEPFATREQRARVAPLQWHDSGPAPKSTPEPLDMTPADAGLPVGAGAGGEPMPGAAEAARRDFPGEWDYLEALDDLVETGEFEAASMLEPMGTAGVYTRYPGNVHTQKWQFAPYNKIGKLYFTTPGGGSSYCTANLISGGTGNNNNIVTAAHCLYSRGQGWNGNFVFVPADRFGAAPYGTYGWRAARVRPEWISQGGRRWDVGVLTLGNNTSTGIPASSYVGWLGRSWNHGYVQNMHSLGYASNLSTQYTHVCSAESFYAGNEGVDVLVKGCDMTFGSSGGGWLRNYLPYSHGGNHVNGVVSGPHIGHFGTTYVGPRFSSANFVPLCDAAGC